MSPLKYRPLLTKHGTVVTILHSHQESVACSPLTQRNLLILFLMKSICFPITKIRAEDTVSWFGIGDAWQVETSEG